MHNTRARHYINLDRCLSCARRTHNTRDSSSQERVISFFLAPQTSSFAKSISAAAFICAFDSDSSRASLQLDAFEPEPRQARASGARASARRRFLISNAHSIRALLLLFVRFDHEVDAFSLSLFQSMRRYVLIVVFLPLLLFACLTRRDARLHSPRLPRLPSAGDFAPLLICGHTRNTRPRR